MVQSNFDERSLGRHLTERKIKDFEKKITQYNFFARVSQYAKTRPKLFTDLGNATVTQDCALYNGTILYGVEKSGELTWLGEIIDSSD